MRPSGRTRVTACDPRAFLCSDGLGVCSAAHRPIMEFVFWLLAVVVAVVALAKARSANERAQAAETEVNHLRRVMENFGHTLAELRKQGESPAAADAAPPPPKSEPKPEAKPE